MLICRVVEGVRIWPYSYGETSTLANECAHEVVAHASLHDLLQMLSPDQVADPMNMAYTSNWHNARNHEQSPLRQWASSKATTKTTA